MKNVLIIISLLIMPLACKNAGRTTIYISPGASSLENLAAKEAKPDSSFVIT